jgi:hydrophobic/amphiphilic exporter-1 (mainly G- bacteria), HAE1 family
MKKNAIAMIGLALEAQRVENKRQFEATYQGCMLRFRPIYLGHLFVYRAAGSV